MIAGCRIDWKEKRLELRVPVLLVASKKSSSEYLRQKGNLLIEEWRWNS